MSVSYSYFKVFFSRLLMKSEITAKGDVKMDALSLFTWGAGGYVLWLCALGTHMYTFIWPIWVTSHS